MEQFALELSFVMCSVISLILGLSVLAFEAFLIPYLNIDGFVSSTSSFANCLNNECASRALKSLCVGMI